MQWLKRPSFRLALLLNHVPIWVFSAGLLIGAPITLQVFDDKLDEIASRVPMETIGAEKVGALESYVHEAWILCFVVFILFALGGSLAALWTHRAVSRRLATIVTYVQRRTAGQDAPELHSQDDDVFGRLEQSIVSVVHEVEERDLKLRAEARLQRFDAQLQRALEIGDSEDDACETVARGLGLIVPDVGVEMLLADASDAHLRRVASNPIVAAPGCPVEGPSQCASIRRGQTLRFESSDALDACPRLRARQVPCSAVCTPVSVMGRSIGVIHAVSDLANPLSKESTNALRLIATHAGTRIGVMRTLSSTRLQAERDGLTGLLNRRSAQDAIARNLRDGERGAFIMLDLDHFKRLNDTLGHEMGDRALKLFAQEAGQVLRPADIVGRWGGEEFALFLPSCGPVEARNVMDRFRRRLSKTLEHSPVASFTFSAGVACYPDHGQAVDELAREADRALYDAKRAGRNQVVVAGEPEDGTPAPLPSVPAGEAAVC